LQLIQKRNRIEFYNLDGDLEDFSVSDDENDQEELELSSDEDF
jgi:hypothetical protein